MVKSFKIPGLGLEIMKDNLKESGLYSYYIKTRLATRKEEQNIDTIIENTYPGQGWRIPDERELRIMGGLTELGVDLGLATTDHPNYINPLISTTASGDANYPLGKISLYCVRVNPKTHGGNWAKSFYYPSTFGSFRYPPEVRLVRSI